MAAEPLLSIRDLGVQAGGRRLLDGFDEDPDDQFGVRSLITLYGAGDGSKAYPQLISAPMDEAGTPIPWVAISGMAGDPEDAATLYAVSDSFLAQPYIYRIDATTTPALVTERIAVGEPETDDQTMGEYDLEGMDTEDLDDAMREALEAVERSAEHLAEAAGKDAGPDEGDGAEDE